MHRGRVSTTPRPLHVLCACDTFKGTLPSDKVGEAVEAGYRQVWRRLHDSPIRTQQQHPPPPVSISPSSDGQTSSTLPAAGLLAHSLYVGHQQQRCNAGAAAVAAEAPAPTNAEVPKCIPADFSHTPMSDGGAGLIDSVTFAASLEAQQDGAGRDDTTTASATTNYLAATATAASAGAAATFHAPPLPSDALHLRRVYVPASAVITGPLGAPLEHTRAVDAAAAASATAGPAPHSLATTGTGVSFACDVARRVLVVEMAEAAGLPRITRPQDRNPAQTTSYGVGELIRYALSHMEGELSGSEDSDAGRRGVRLFLGIGGSSTNDGGLGALQALGLEIFVQPSTSAAAACEESSGVRLEQPFRGSDLSRITHVRMGETMLQLFPYLPLIASPDTAAVAAATDHIGVKGAGLHIAEVCLICDVDNTLVGSSGATYTFGPQKCAPPAASTTTKEGAAGDDAAVGAITSTAQKALLDSLEAGMRHAATRVVGSTWRQLVQSSEWPRVRASAAAVAAGDVVTTAQSEGEGDEAAVLADLLYRPGGGGAGGMSGFFRYLLRASYVPGADMVGGLLGLYETPRVARLLGSSGDSTSAADDQEGQPLSRTCATVLTPHGCLFNGCDVVVSGEGSFDHQTISSHKTVGRLLEMCTAANAYRLWRHHCHPAPAEETAHPNASTEEHHGDGRCRTIDDFIVVCGRTSFEDYASCQADVLQSVCTTLAPSDKAGTEGESSETMRVNLYLQDLLQSAAFLGSSDGVSPSAEAQSAADILRRCCVPRVTVLPLTPTLFSFADATQQPYACVSSAVADLLEDSVARLAAASTTTASAAS